MRWLAPQWVAVRNLRDPEIIPDSSEDLDTFDMPRDAEVIFP